MLLDKHKRHITYLRVSVTDRCNLRCIYCIPNKYIPRLKHHDILTYEEMLRIIKVFVELGIRKVRIKTMPFFFFFLNNTLISNSSC